ncbi:MAG: protein kinase [bacterium]|nr:protein kinase [bacterium]
MVKKYVINVVKALIIRFKREFHITQKMAGAGVIRAHGQVKYGHNPALVLADFQGVSLHDYLSTVEKIDLRQCLRSVLEMSQGLGHIHQQNVIHKDINPHNIPCLSHFSRTVRYFCSSNEEYGTRNVYDHKEKKLTLLFCLFKEWAFLSMYNKG